MKKLKFLVLALVVGILFLFLPRKDPYTLEDTIKNSLKGAKGEYGVVVKNMTTEEEYRFNENKIFEAGSLYKLWVMAEVFEQIQKGKLLEDEVLSQDIEDLNQKFNLATDEAELTQGNVSMSVAQALNQMVTISHNYAALLLSDRVGNSQVVEFIKKNGFTNSSFSPPPKTTASDIASFYEKLYRGEIVNKEYSEKMIEILKKQKLNDGLPKNLPKNVQVAHKTGEIGWFKHDAGIVFSEKGNYIIVVLSKSNSPGGAQERISQISKAVYDYFSRPTYGHVSDP